ncbi:MAG: protoporphyrinogen oxidase, partial [Bacteriovoracaceae bacterium]
YFLLKRGFQVEIFETKPGPGGLIQTIKTNRGLVETAATSILLTTDLEEIIKDIKIDYLLPNKKSRKKYISVNHSPRRIPLKPLDLLFLFKGIFNLIFNKKKIAPQKSESLSSWSDRVFNNEVTKKLVSPAMTGIYADSSQNLSATLVLRKIFSKDKKKKSKGPVNFIGGMGNFISALEGYLIKNHVHFHYNSQINDLSSLKNPFVIATSYQQARDLKVDLPQIPLKNMSSVTLFFDGSPPLEGFGTLFPEDEKMNSQGVLFNTSMFEGRTNKGYSETWILSDKTELSNEKLLEAILKDREKVFKTDQSPIDLQVNHWPKAFPLYGPELELFLSREFALPKPAYLTGNYLGNLGLSGIIEQNKLLSIKMAQELI